MEPGSQEWIEDSLEKLELWQTEQSELEAQISATEDAAALEELSGKLEHVTGQYDALLNQLEEVAGDEEADEGQDEVAVTQEADSTGAIDSDRVPESSTVERAPADTEATAAEASAPIDDDEFPGDAIAADSAGADDVDAAAPAGELDQMHAEQPAPESAGDFGDAPQTVEQQGAQDLDPSEPTTETHSEVAQSPAAAEAAVETAQPRQGKGRGRGKGKARGRNRKPAPAAAAAARAESSEDVAATPEALGQPAESAEAAAPADAAPVSAGSGFGDSRSMNPNDLSGFGNPSQAPAAGFGSDESDGMLDYDDPLMAPKKSGAGRALLFIGGAALTIAAVVIGVQVGDTNTNANAATTAAISADKSPAVAAPTDAAAAKPEPTIIEAAPVPEDTEAPKAAVGADVQRTETLEEVNKRRSKRRGNRRAKTNNRRNKKKGKQRRRNRRNRAEQQKKDRKIKLGSGGDPLG